MIEPEDYFRLRQLVAQEDAILQLEQRYIDDLATHLVRLKHQIKRDFDSAYELLPFWINYPPLDRGRAPLGLAIPWQEVGETVLRPYLYSIVENLYPDVRYPGLPSGADIRFMTSEAVVHLDIKLTGPNDHPNEVVASHNQISGDGALWQGKGATNNAVIIMGERRMMTFQPELLPFYVFDGHIRLSLTLFLKVIYNVEEKGKQPLQRMDLALCPNGLLAFDGPSYNTTMPGLFIPGKDIVEKIKRRVRVRLNHLKLLHSWRIASISF